MRYIFGGKNYYIAIPPPLFAKEGKAIFLGGKSTIAIFPPIQVRGKNIFRVEKSFFRGGGGKWLYNTGTTAVPVAFSLINLFTVSMTRHGGGTNQLLSDDQLNLSASMPLVPLHQHFELKLSHFLL
jgi:hypothetical protein